MSTIGIHISNVGWREPDTRALRPPATNLRSVPGPDGIAFLRPNKVSWCLLVVLTFAASSSAAGAAASDGPKDARQLEVFRLRNADAKAVAKGLLDLLQDNGDMRITADVPQNFLVVYGTKEDLASLKPFLALLERSHKRRDRAGASAEPPARVPSDKDFEKLSDRDLRMLVLGLCHQVQELRERVGQLEAKSILRTVPIPPSK